MRDNYMIMKTIKLVPFLFLFACASPGRTGYLITDYDSRGKVENAYTVKEYDVLGDEVKFLNEGKIKSVRGSFKIEKLTNE